MKDSYSFVHLSDIHFGQELANESLIIHNDVRKRLLDDLDEFQTISPAADGVWIVGDVSFSGKASQFADASAFIEQVLKKTGCPSSNVYVVPGNHDVDNSRCDTILKGIHSTVLSRSEQDPDFLRKCLLQKETGALLLSKLENFNAFAAKFGCGPSSGQGPLWTETFLFSTGTALCLTGLSTVNLCHKELGKGEMFLGPSQFVLDPSPGTEYCVMMHHPPDWLRDGVDASRYFDSRARVKVYGHEHHLKLEPKATPGGFQSIDVYSGSTNPPKMDEYAFRYNWVVFSSRIEGSNQILTLDVYPRVWNIHETRFEEDEGLTGGGMRVTKEFVTSLDNSGGKLSERPTEIPAVTDPDGEGTGPASSSVDAVAEQSLPTAAVVAQLRRAFAQLPPEKKASVLHHFGFPLFESGIPRRVESLAIDFIIHSQNEEEFLNLIERS